MTNLTSSQEITVKAPWHLPSDQRGHFDFGWLDTRHSFTFGDYQNPDAMGFSVLRVINEDIVQPGQCFGTHGHRDMEIVTYVLSGRLQHTDSLGNTAYIEPGTIQRMSAGSGIRHGESNPSTDTPVHLLQIWLYPDKNGLKPGYEERVVAELGANINQWQSIIRSNKDTRVHDSMTINQDASLWVANLSENASLSLPIDNLSGRRQAWVQVISGSIQLKGPQEDDATLTLKAGDGLGLYAASENCQLLTESGQEAHVLVFDLPVAEPAGTEA